MKVNIFIPELFKVSSGFFINLATAWFLTIFISPSIVEMINRILLTLTSFYLSVIYEKRYDSN